MCIDMQIVLYVALFDIRGKCRKNSEFCSYVVHSNSEEELRISGILVIVNNVVCDSVSVTD